LKASVAAVDIDLVGTASVKLAAPVIILAGGVMLLPGPGGGSAVMQSAAPIAINAPEVSINEGC
ncbi:MAG: hypothetical protein LBD82_06425, partial [Deltaproteobacteria bacterium]|nr:hypothetical protein [Deltaproteobacteria bacterium]